MVYFYQEDDSVYKRLTSVCIGKCRGGIKWVELIMSWMSQMKTGLFQYTLGRFLLTSVSVAKNATGLHFTPRCSPNLQGCLESFLRTSWADCFINFQIFWLEAENSHLWQWEVISSHVMTFKNRFNLPWYRFHTTRAGWNVKIKHIKSFVVLLSSWSRWG